MVNYFKSLLPVTTILDDLFVPQSIDKKFYNEKRYFIAGFHCTTWVKLFIIFAIILFIIVFENILEDATYMKAEFYESGRQYNGILDLLLEWDQSSYSFYYLCISTVVLSIASIFLITILMEFAYLLVPMQLILTL